MLFSSKGNEKVTPRRALIEDTVETAPRHAKPTRKLVPQIAKGFVLAVLLLGMVVGDTQANLAEQASASVSAPVVPAVAVAQTATSTTSSAPAKAKPIPKVAKTTATVKPKVEQNESFAAAVTVPKRTAAPRVVAVSADVPKKASSAPKKASAPKKVSAPKKKAAKPAAASTSSSSTKGERALAYARKQIGEPYRYGGVGPYGFDCSGLTMKAWAAAGVRGLPHSARQQMSKGKKVSKSNLRKGDLVFFYSPVRHVGLYAGNGKVLHASNPSKPIGYLEMKYMPYAGAVRPG